MQKCYYGGYSLHLDGKLVFDLVEVDEDSFVVVGTMEGVREGEGHLGEVACDHGHRGKEKVLGSKMVASERLVWDDDSCASVWLRLATYVALGAVRTLQISHV